MKRLLFASTALALIGGGGANAQPIDTLTNVVIWSAATPGAVETDPSQLALPNMINPIMTPTNLQASGPATGAVNFNLQGPFPGATSRIRISSPPTPAGGPPAIRANPAAHVGCTP